MSAPGRAVSSGASAGSGLALFALGSGRPFAERVARDLGLELAVHEEREFAWGDALEVHSVTAFQNEFRCQTEHLGAHDLFAEFFAKSLEGREP